jgi:hypothetical protein
MYRVSTVMLLAGAVIIGCSGNSKANPNGGSQGSSAAATFTTADQNGATVTGRENGSQGQSSTAEQNGAGDNGGGTNTTAAGIPGVSRSGQAKETESGSSGKSYDKHRHSGTPAGTGPGR